jgi:hypothetical protein
MSKLMHAALTLAAGGLTLTAIELLLPRSGIRRTAKTAIGLVFLELLAAQIADIFR